MPLQQVDLTLRRADASTRLQLMLDPQIIGQKGILEPLAANRPYEPETTRIVRAFLQPGDTFIDIGAHVGFFTVFAAALVGPAGTVFAFEPEPSNYSHLLLHLNINHLTNVRPFCWAVGSTSEEVDFYFNSDCDAGHALWDPGLLANNPQSRAHRAKSKVYQVSLDAFFPDARPGAVKLIKIDTEGNDLNVLRGAKRFLHAAQVPAVIAEIHSFGLAKMNGSEREMRDLMAELEYIPYLLVMDKPTRLAPGQFLKSKYVFNLLFVRPELQQSVAGLWPQSTSLEAALRYRRES